MKSILTISAMTLFLLAGCVGNKQQVDDFITVDVTANYPEKELILQDILNVEYVALETSEEFITHGILESVGKEIMLVRNRTDGNIFVFDRAGKGLRKINRLGQGAEEYAQISDIILDEAKKEMFVVDYPARKILVYDLYGKFNRSFKFADTSYYNNLFDYDEDHLICFKSYTTPKENEKACHLIVSKQDGSVTHEIQIPITEVETPVVTKDELTVMPEFYQTFPNKGNWALVNTSSDTVYNYLPDGRLIPFIARTPSIHSMEVEVFLFPSILTDRYYFMRAMKKELNFKTFKGFPSTDLIYDRQEKALFQYVMYNSDFSDKTEVYLNLKPVNQEIIATQSFNASDLIDANGKGQLKGNLKEIVANLEEESNPVIMLVTLK